MLNVVRYILPQLGTNQTIKTLTHLQSATSYFLLLSFLPPVALRLGAGLHRRIQADATQCLNNNSD